MIFDILLFCYFLLKVFLLYHIILYFIVDLYYFSVGIIPFL